MAAPIDTGTMVTPGYRSQTLGHLGLVAGMFDELGIAEVLDRVIVQDRAQRLVSVGQAVKAMVLNGLGFVNRTLYLTPAFYADKPTERLLGAGIRPEHLHDDTLGRALDALYEHDVTGLYALVAAQACRRLGLVVTVGHLDITSFHVDGAYNSAEEPEAKVVHITPRVQPRPSPGFKPSVVESAGGASRRHSVADEAAGGQRQRYGGTGGADR